MVSIDKAQLQKELDRLMNDVRREKDELTVKAHLFKADAKDEWDKVEKKWQQFSHKAEAFGQEAQDASGDVGAALKLLGEELKHSFQRLKKKL
ncbi:hypothetical protein LJ739_05500 [Aestuariibacter halophilus]|uniref:Uncharacterized protein n=1 Tax=Fluctibacter halophilus TaxID=226011 RepID=A0ABS8G788_9ALTE|nr:hypothetical protein [Aestuariibacter halophilus]MCC2615690.1 hypothetical protein [Aestuariibacter halophilus]